MVQDHNYHWVGSSCGQPSATNSRTALGGSSVFCNITIPLRISWRLTFLRAKLALCPAVTRGTLTRFRWIFRIVTGMKSSVLFGPYKVNTFTLDPYHPHGVSIVNNSWVHHSSHNGSGVRDRESIVDQELRRPIDKILAMKREYVQERSYKVDSLSCDIRYPEDWTYIWSRELSLLISATMQSSYRCNDNGINVVDEHRSLPAPPSLQNLQ